MRQTTPDDITARVLAAFEGCEDPRLRVIMQTLVRHLHGLVSEIELTFEEWQAAIAQLTATGHITDERRQEWILWSDVLGLSMLVDALGHRSPPPATESTVLGPFYVPGSPLRAYGDHIDEVPAGEQAWIYGVVRSLDGTPIAGAELDVWQNGDNELYAVQDPQAPEDHLRGRFATREDGTYGFVAVRPTPYPIPDDGPVGKMLQLTGRHPWRPAHIHMIVRAPGHVPVATHVFDRTSTYIDSDAVFAVKESLLRDFRRRDADDADKPEGMAPGPWFSLESDFVLAPGEGHEPVDPGRTA
jgi:catechol 1,2-dioxygenase